jgi:hypothetical protein
LFNVWDRIEENVFADDVTNALAKIFPNDPPRFLARTPHGYHDTALIRSELEEAGFSRVVIETRADGRGKLFHHGNLHDLKSEKAQRVEPMLATTVLLCDLIRGR